MNRNQEAFDVLGVALQWKLRAAETDGQYCILEAVVPPGVMVPPHQHREQEAFFMLEGTGEFASLQHGELVWNAVHAGEMVNIPSDAVHGFRNTTDRNLRCLITGHPKLEGFFLEAGTPLPSADSIPGAPGEQEIGRVLAIAMQHGQRFLPPPSA